MKFHLLFISLLLCLLLAVPALAAPSYEVTVWDCDPPNMDVRASRAIGRGILINISAENSEDENATFTFHFFLTDTTENHNIIFRETRQIANSPLFDPVAGQWDFNWDGVNDANDILDFNGTTGEPAWIPADIYPGEVGDDGYWVYEGDGVISSHDLTYHLMYANHSYTYDIETRNNTLNRHFVIGADTIDWNNSYFLFFGLEIGTYTRDNTLFFSDDGSVLPSNFSTEGNARGDNVKIGTGYADEYTGAYLYFEPGFYDSYVDISLPGITDFGVMVINYGNSIGMPWFYLLIAFLIAAIVVCIPLSFALKYHFDLPNFIYGILIVVGVSLDFVLGLLYLWMFALFILFTLFILIIRFKDQLESLMPWRASQPTGFRPKKEKEEKVKRYPFKQSRLPIKSSVGIAPQRVRKPVKQTSQMPLTRPPLENEPYRISQLSYNPKHSAMWSVFKKERR